MAIANVHPWNCAGRSDVFLPPTMEAKMAQAVLHHPVDKSREFGVPAVVDRSTFQAELDALRVREKAHTREGDAIAAARRRLPMVEVDGATPLIGERGAA